MRDRSFLSTCSASRFCNSWRPSRLSAGNAFSRRLVADCENREKSVRLAVFIPYGTTPPGKLQPDRASTTEVETRVFCSANG
eukprot:scaffold150254_cov41-Prasinocladus_malaysianus.AAC.2